MLQTQTDFYTFKSAFGKYICNALHTFVEHFIFPFFSTNLSQSLETFPGTKCQDTEFRLSSPYKSFHRGLTTDIIGWERNGFLSDI